MKYLALALMLCLTACDQPPSADQKQQQAQADMNIQAVNSVGMPAITNWQEKRILKNILELRDQQISTVTYITDLYGHLHKVCDSIGYGIPYSTQYTAPERTATYNDILGVSTPFQGHETLMPQAEPNGLFSPASADGTWVMCLDPASKKLAPVYIEPHVVVSPFPIDVK
jgi:hypothetical protein